MFAVVPLASRFCLLNAPREFLKLESRYKCELTVACSSFTGKGFLRESFPNVYLLVFFSIYERPGYSILSIFLRVVTSDAYSMNLCIGVLMSC